ncbi:TMEM165/GDT1 family protein [Ornithinicoccus halotolerans]|uniref:TMEM165/GDT1 family protein n=1 Tax=Ornithinicoccus halotolerans TaxID=1748220 RepID=UPI0012952FEF|nr:TMEM165/GDT1 family protein [Ornithinicoccus halotolerans]
MGPVSLNLVTAAVVFAAIFPVELPDKTFVATLVLATRYRPLLVWLGVGLAFVVQTAIAVTLGGLLASLPRTPVELAAAALFLAGGVYLWRTASRADEEEHEAEEEFSHKGRVGATGLGAVATCFSVLFLAEWGDLSQLLTASLAARYDDPFSVGLGAVLALLTVSGLGALSGRVLLERLRLSLVRRVGGTVCLALATITLLGVTGLW